MKYFFKSIFSIFLILTSCQNILFSATTLSQKQGDFLEDFFSEAYIVTEETECIPICRMINDKYKSQFTTKIMDFDPSTGITTCEVFASTALNNIENTLSINANTLNQTCADNYNTIKLDYNNENLISQKYSKNNSISKVTLQPYDNSTITLSRFLGGLATLDNEIIDIAQSIDGTVVKKDPNAIYKLTSEGGLELDSSLLNSIDTLSQDNLSYYIDLFYSMDNIYDYIVSYIFVFISLFFMLVYISRIAFKKMAKKTLAFEEPWQSKIAVITLAAVIFFIPMRLDDSYSSTLFQNIWKYFVSESSSIADRANNTAMSTYMEKVYNTVGISGVKTEANLLLTKDQQEFIQKQTEPTLDECKDRYKDLITFQHINKEQIAQKEEIKSSNGKYTLTLIGCRNIEKRHKLATTLYEQTNHNLNRIKAAYETNIIQDRIDNMTDHLDKRVKELGWYSAILAPTVQVLTKISFMQGVDKSSSLAKYDENFVPGNMITRANINQANAQAIKQEGGKVEESGDWLANILNPNAQGSKDNKTEKEIAKLLSQNAYRFLPGFSQISTFIKNLGETNTEALAQKLPLGENTSKSAEVSTEVKALNLTSSLIRYIIEFLPFITSFIAIGVIIVMYLYELIIFSFISPFMVAFAVTTGQARKIFDFLVTAITIFLKPTLIVIAVYLSLFLYSIFQELFMLMAEEQFYLSDESISDFLPVFIFTFIRELLLIFSSLIAVYLMWKLIMEMPNFVYKLVGVDKLDSGSQMATNMQQQFGKFGFRA